MRKLLKMVNKKFGVSFDESIFWSEALRKLSAIKKVKPLVTDRFDKKLAEIEKYFRQGSNRFLQKMIK